MVARLPRVEVDHQLLADLRTAEIQISLGEAAYARRRELVTRAWEAGMMSQLELAAYLTAAASDVGGDEVTSNAIHKMVAKERGNGE